jgi:serine protease Do
MSRDHSTLAFLMNMFAALAVAGCASSPAIRTFEDLQPRAVVGESRPIMFRKLISKIPEGTPVGTFRQGDFCLPNRPLTWDRPEGTPIAADSLAEDLSATLTSELTKAGYKVIGAAGSLFEESQESRADFLLGGSVTHLAWDQCLRPGAVSWGEVAVEVEWQLFDRRPSTVVLTSTTGGTFRTPTSPNGARRAFLGAFAAALRNLLADERFPALTSR